MVPDNYQFLNPRNRAVKNLSEEEENLHTQKRKGIKECVTELGVTSKEPDALFFVKNSLQGVGR